MRETVRITRRTLSDRELLYLLGIIARHADFLRAMLHTDHLFIVCSHDWLWFPWFTAAQSSETRWRLVDFLCWLAQEGFPDRTVKWELRWIAKDLRLQTPQRKHLFSIFKRKGRDYELSGL